MPPGMRIGPSPHPGLVRITHDDGGVADARPEVALEYWTPDEVRAAQSASPMSTAPATPPAAPMSTAPAPIPWTPPDAPTPAASNERIMSALTAPVVAPAAPPANPLDAVTRALTPPAPAGGSASAPAVLPDFLQPPPAPPFDPFARRPGETFGPINPAEAAPVGPPQAPRPRRRAAPEAPRPPTEAELNQQTIDQLMGGPVAPQDSAPPSALDQQIARISEGERIAREAAHAEAVTAAERQDLLEQAAAQDRALEAQRQAATLEAQRRYQAAFEEARSTNVNPHRLIGTAGGMIGVAIATVLGGLGAALTGGPNRALESIERAIDRDIQGQAANQRNAQANVGNARTFLDITRQQFSDAAAAQSAARALAWNQVAERAAQQAAQLRDQGAALRAQELAAEARSRAAAAQQAAIVAQQDRELALSRELLEQRKLAAEATRAERRAAGVGMGGGARGVVPRELMGTAQDPLVQEAVRLGTSEAVAMDMAADTTGGRSSGRSRLQQMVGREGIERGRIDTGSQVPGWVQGEGAPILSPTERATIRNVSIADGEFSRAVARLERVLSEIGVGERISGRLGFGSERYQEAQHAIEVIRNQMRQISDMGNSLGAQSAIEHSIPDLNANTTADAILRNVRAASRVKHDYVLSLMESYGYHPAAGGHSGGASSAPLPSGVRPRGATDEHEEGEE